ncbi:MAG: CHAD domain-containing protein, partial [Planctomycetota bacterium]
MANQLESEFKLRARRPLEVAVVDAALREIGVCPSRIESRLQVDSYLDDPRRTLLLAGMGLRIRQCGTQRLLSLKTKQKNAGNLIVRGEIEAAWPSDEPPRRIEQLPPDLREAIGPQRRDFAMDIVLTLTTHREVRMLRPQGDDQDACELVIDHVVAAAGSGRRSDRATQFAEVELEVLQRPEWCEQIAQALRTRLPLEFATVDKPSHASALLGLERPRNESTQDILAEPAGAALARLLAADIANMRGLAASVHEVASAVEDAASVRKLRGSIRRMRSLTTAFGKLWPADARQRLKAELTELAHHCAQTRHLDDLLASLPTLRPELPEPQRRQLDATQAWLEDERNACHQQLRAWLSRHGEPRIAQLAPAVALLGRGHGPAAEPLAAAGLRAWRAAIDKLRKQTRRFDPELAPNQARRVRLAATRVRDLADAIEHRLTAAAAGRPADRPRAEATQKPLRKVLRLRQQLGRARGHQRIADWIAQHSASAPGGPPPDAVADVLNAIAAIERRRAAAEQPAILRRIERLDRKGTWR